MCWWRARPSTSRLAPGRSWPASVPDYCQLRTDTLAPRHACMEPARCPPPPAPYDSDYSEDSGDETVPAGKVFCVVMCLWQDVMARKICVSCPCEYLGLLHVYSYCTYLWKKYSTNNSTAPTTTTAAPLPPALWCVGRTKRGTFYLSIWCFLSLFTIKNKL